MWRVLGAGRSTEVLDQPECPVGTCADTWGQLSWLDWDLDCPASISCSTQDLGNLDKLGLKALKHFPGISVNFPGRNAFKETVKVNKNKGDNGWVVL